MEPFFTWLSHYWWLIFPVMGMAGGVAKGWERSAKRRHERRLETLRMKAQLKTAEIEARALNQQMKRRGPSIVDTTASVAPNDLLLRLFAEHDEITARWLDYELDVAKLIAFPAMSDGRQPLTAAFLRAKKTADALRPASAEGKATEHQVAEYLQAVGDYAVAFEIAEKDARRLRDSTFTEPERKRLDRAQQLLKVAIDESATQSERNVAYKRVREELDGLILLSDDAVTVLEKQVAREISAPVAQAPPAAEPAAPEPERIPVADPLRVTDPLRSSPPPYREGA
ncbi:hypothetical protein [Microbacterium sp. PMB16]|uniref:hypothetical protein n=1 Tax=Microbacterium sp. PMB16 TaxID=3120157 RepID=UPI003F4C0BD7